jgi:hypothetical protein
MFDDLLLNAVKKLFNINDIKPSIHYDSDSSSDEDLPPKRTNKSFKKPIIKKYISDSDSDDDSFSKRKPYQKPKCVSDDEKAKPKHIKKPFKCNDSDSEDDKVKSKLNVKKSIKCDSDSEDDKVKPKHAKKSIKCSDSDSEDELKTNEDAFFKKLAKQHENDHKKKLNAVFSKTKKACSDISDTNSDKCDIKPRHVAALPITHAPLKTNWYCIELSNFKPYTTKTTNPNTEYLAYAYDASNNPYTFDVSSSFNEFFTKNNKTIRVSKTGNYKIKGICYNDISTAVPGQENNTIVQSLFIYRNQKTSLFFNVRDYDNINASSDTMLASSDDELEFKLKFKSADIPSDFKLKLFISPTI